ncbi:MAG: Transcriptional regulatory protein LiaR [Nitrospira sp.]
MTIRVLITDDHAVLRAGLRVLIDAQRDMQVVGEAGDGHEAVAKTIATKPDVILLDLSMPEHSGLRAIPSIRQQSPGARVLVLSMYEDIACLRAALDSGAAGYVSKKVADTELLAAIRAVAGGRKYFCSCSLELLVQASSRLDLSGVDARDVDASTLSKREREVLTMVVEGYTHRQIAERLGVSIKSVESYRTRVQEKLGLQTRVELHRYALARGLLCSDGLREPDSPAKS